MKARSEGAAGPQDRTDGGTRVDGRRRRKSEVFLRILQHEAPGSLSRGLGIASDSLTDWCDEVIAAMQVGRESREPKCRYDSSHNVGPRWATRPCSPSPSGAIDIPAYRLRPSATTRLRSEVNTVST